EDADVELAERVLEHAGPAVALERLRAAERDLDRRIAHVEVLGGMQHLLARRGRIAMHGVDRRPAAAEIAGRDEHAAWVELEGERAPDPLGDVRVACGQLLRERGDLLYEALDRRRVERAVAQIGDGGERRVALEERAARDRAVALRVRERRARGREAV